MPDTDTSHILDVMNTLDCLARHHTCKTLQKITTPLDRLTFDRQKYLDWAVRLCLSPLPDQVVPRSDMNVLVQLTERVAASQAGT